MVRNWYAISAVLISLSPIERLQEDLREQACTGMYTIYLIFMMPIQQYSCSTLMITYKAITIIYMAQINVNKLNPLASIEIILSMMTSFAASTVIDVEITSIFRELDFKTKLYLEYFVPGEGFTIQVELDIGRVVVCGSNSLERPDCSYSLTYDWKLEISEYEELFIGPDGFPSNDPAPSRTPIPTNAPTQGTSPTGTPMYNNVTTTNITVYT